MSNNNPIDPRDFLAERMEMIRYVDSVGAAHRELAILSSELGSKIGVRARSGPYVSDLVLTQDGSAELNIGFITIATFKERVQVVEESIFSLPFDPSYMEWMVSEERNAEGRPWTLVRLLIQLSQKGEADVRLAGLVA